MRIHPYLRPENNTDLLIVQGWSSIIPVFSPVSFASFYIEIPVMLLFYTVWKLRHRMPIPNLDTIDLYVDEHVESAQDEEEDAVREARTKGKWRGVWRAYYLLA